MWQSAGAPGLASPAPYPGGRDREPTAPPGPLQGVRLNQALRLSVDAKEMTREDAIAAQLALVGRGRGDYLV